MIARVFDGKAEGLTRDDVLDNITLYWLTNTAISSARLYWDTAQLCRQGGFFDVRGIKIPVAVSAFPDEIYQAPQSWAENAYPKLIHYNRLEKAATSRPGNSRPCSRPKSALASGHYASRSEPPSSPSLPGDKNVHSSGNALARLIDGFSRDD